MVKNIDDYLESVELDIDSSAVNMMNKIPRLCVIVDFRFVLKRDENNTPIWELSTKTLDKCLEDFDYILLPNIQSSLDPDASGSDGANKFAKTEIQLNTYLTKYSRIIMVPDIMGIYTKTCELLNLPSRSPSLVFRSKEFLAGSVKLGINDHIGIGMAPDKEKNMREIFEERYDELGSNW